MIFQKAKSARSAKVVPNDAYDIAIEIWPMKHHVMIGPIVPFGLQSGQNKTTC